MDGSAEPHTTAVKRNERGEDREPLASSAESSQQLRLLMVDDPGITFLTVWDLVTS